MENNEKDLNEQDEQTTVGEEVQNEAAEEAQNADAAETEENGNEKLCAELSEVKDRMLRLAAEFDNFKKRTAKEKEELYASAVCDTVKEFLPVFDNLERAAGTLGDTPEESAVADGVKMILKQFGDTLSSIGVEKIETEDGFDPELHNAVMHIEDDSYGEGEIAEVLMHGYKYKGKVIRYSMVKVAN